MIIDNFYTLAKPTVAATRVQWVNKRCNCLTSILSSASRFRAGKHRDFDGLQMRCHATRSQNIPIVTKTDQNNILSQNRFCHCIQNVEIDQDIHFVQSNGRSSEKTSCQCDCVHIEVKRHRRCPNNLSLQIRLC